MIEFQILFSHVLNGFFIQGTNPWRPLLFVVYGIVVAAFYFSFRRIVTRFPRYSKISTIVSLISITALFLSGLFLQITTFSGLAIPYTTQAHFFTEREYTLSRLNHIHFGKVALTPLTEPLSTVVEKYADGGGALVAFVPEAVPLLSCILLLIALIATFFAGSYVIASAPSVSRAIGSFLLFTLVSYLVLSSSIDGGLLQTYGLFTFVLYASFLFSSRTTFAWWMCGASFAALLSLSVLFFIPELSYSFDSFVANVASLGIFGIFIVALFLWRFGAQRFQSILILSCILLLGLGIKSAGDDMRYLRATLSPEYGYISSYEELPSDVALVGRVGELRLYALPEGVSPQETLSLIRQYRLPWWYHPVSHTKERCSSLETDTFTVISQEPLFALSTSTPFATTSLVFQNHKKDEYRYAGTLEHSVCVPDARIVVQELLVSLGARSFVVY